MSRLPIMVICWVTFFVVVAEKLCGTDTYFATGVGVTFIAIGITYNLLGGLKTISGILFTEFALRTIVISQFAKIYYREPADLNLEAAHLTIAAYAVFYGCVAAASVLFGRLRLPLPRPIEPGTASQRRLLYVIAVAGGMIGTLLLYIQGFNTATAHLTLSHSLGEVLEGLLLFSLVLAIDDKLRVTAGQHSLGWTVAIPYAAVVAESLVSTKRGVVAAPVILYFLICYLRGYRFGRRHLVGAVAFFLFFLFVYSPFELYMRSVLGTGSLDQRVSGVVQVLKQPPRVGDPGEMEGADEGAYEGRHGYLSATDNGPLGRMTLMWSDSTLISASASGYYYGWTPIMMDLAASVPRFINPNKPDDEAPLYVGSYSGMNTLHADDSADLSFSAIGTIFGAFGMAGVVALGLFVVPLFFAVLHNVFDLKSVWGIVALALMLPAFGEWGPASFVSSMLYQVGYLIFLSWVLNAIVNLVPTAASPELRFLARNSAGSGLGEPLTHD